jgi:hypothetical protein
MSRSARRGAVTALALFWAALAGCSGSIDDKGGAGGAAGIAVVGGGSGGGGACVPSGSGGGSGSSAIPPTFATVKLVLAGGGAIMPCASAPCHAAGGNAPPGHPLTLQDTPQLYANMLSFVSSACGNIPLVNPGTPEESALLKILRGPCGATPRMPYMCSGDACIPDDYIAALSQWVASCAPEQ